MSEDIDHRDSSASGEEDARARSASAGLGEAKALDKWIRPGLSVAQAEAAALRLRAPWESPREPTASRKLEPASDEARDGSVAPGQPEVHHTAATGTQLGPMDASARPSSIPAAPASRPSRPIYDDDVEPAGDPTWIKKRRPGRALWLSALGAAAVGLAFVVWQSTDSEEKADPALGNQAQAGAPSEKNAAAQTPAPTDAPTRAAYRTLRVTLTTPRAELRIDGQTIAAPAVLRLPKGKKVQVEAKAPQRAPFKQTLVLDEDEDLVVSLDALPTTAEVEAEEEPREEAADVAEEKARVDATAQPAKEEALPAPSPAAEQPAKPKPTRSAVKRKSKSQDKSMGAGFVTDNPY